MVDMHRHLPTEHENQLPESWDILFATSSIEAWESARALTLSPRHKRGYGLLPESLAASHVTNKFIRETSQNLYRILENDSLGYIGEIGFDSRFKHSLPYAKQKDLLWELLRIARELQRPVVLHHVGPVTWLEDMLLLCNHAFPVLIHGFIKSIEVAQRLTQLGAIISLGPSLWTQSTKLAKRLFELDTPFLIETDYPYVRTTAFSGMSYEQIVKSHVAQIAYLMHAQSEQIEEQCDGYAQIFTNW